MNEAVLEEAKQVATRIVEVSTRRKHLHITFYLGQKVFCYVK